MKISCIIGSHPRHLYFLNRIKNHFKISSCLIVKREKVIPEIPKLLTSVDRKNYIRHFKDRQIAEKKYFGVQSLPEINHRVISQKELNTLINVKYIRYNDPDIVVIFGSNLIKEPLYSSLPKNTINLHLGLSPRYRGSATLFWPFYFLEPTYAGCTFHHIINEPDSGDIIHQSIPVLDENDGIHDVACKSIIKSSNDVIELINIFKVRKFWSSYKQRSTGKKFLKDDFKPEHLRVIYDLYSNKIVKEYLDGKLRCKKPKLIKQF